MINIEKNVFKSIVVYREKELVRVDEGNTIRFTTEGGEDKEGKLTKISGKNDKTKLTIVPIGSEHEEVWSVMVIAENTLRVVG